MPQQNQSNSYWEKQASRNRRPRDDYDDEQDNDDSDDYEPEYKKHGQTHGIGSVLHALWELIIWPFMAVWGFLVLINNIRKLLITIATIIVLSIVIIILMFVFKPPFLWNPFKQFLNNNQNPPIINQVDTDSIYARITNNIVHGQDTVLDNSDLTSLFHSTIPSNFEYYVVADTDTLRFYINIDTKDQPLWLIMEMKKQDSGNFGVDKIGFGRFDFPGFVSGILTNALSSVVSVFERQISAESLVIVFNQVLDKNKIDKDLVLKKVTLEQNKAVLTYK